MVPGTYTAHHGGLVTPCHDVTGNASRRCLSAGFHLHFQAGVARGGWVAPKSAGGRTWKGGRSRKDGVDC